MIFYRPFSGIEAMTFDLDDTLYDNRPIIRRVEQQMALWLYEQHPISKTKPLSWWHQIKVLVATNEPELKHDVTRWRYRQIEVGLSALGYDDPKAQLAATQAIEEVLRLRSDFTVPQETHRVMTKLAQRMPLVAITNGNVDVDRIGLGQYFQGVYKAGPDGLSKPDSDLFNQALSFLNLPADKVLHVGDHLRSDVRGAYLAGMKSCWINDQDSSLMKAKHASALPDVEIAHLASLLDL
ncbi:5-amino-6-(5-phospho-D-ribitylamino)uracil phosphatase YigB [Vibrio agarivorans]|uniref:5-amino-6-(5-phospho-D-ribitylamino)uracil phosphatase YigB n=1 Tax=Vibrio agarivorans TaxID=153622 RepID=UPI0025B3DFEB|nr:5-amino-6-(5-phospho-D-ribitylamino)uracil phosphatase YigB [Vibrio agarivorans]MDN3661895.1 5-amino-6-(5-phospho-D-ribitylamino)uracil phosphatase YigB [Vibrio agarivorans]